MNNSFVWRFAGVIRFIPAINLLIILRLQSLVLKGYITRGKLFVMGVQFSIPTVALIVPTILISDHFGCLSLAKCVIIPLIIYLGGVLLDTLAIREEKRVRDSGFFWSEENKKSS